MNMMKYCPECYKELPPNSASCPFCGYRTGNGDSEEKEAPRIIKAPQVDSYIPPEQTVLSMMLLLIFFWGINIAITTLPIFLNAGTTKNIIIAAIVSQVLTRVMIGLWAVEEQSLKRDSTPNKKIGAFMLSFVPIGGIYSFLHASRTIIRKDRLSNMTISAVFAVLLMSVMLFATKDGINFILTGEKPPVEEIASPDPTMTVIAIEDTAIPPTPTLRIYQGGCRNPNSVTPDEEGDTITVCGVVTNFGEFDCESCPDGFYSFIKLDGGFQIVSYNYHFSFAFLDDCIAIKDEVEILGDGAVFQYNNREECTVNDEDELICEKSNYFQESDSCR
ncbi:MAG: zinc ribbon domain-containing protein [Anaerolineales bacterium]|nr:zinc ribbon domain-containing protein [Anaerolineales bacterium]